MSEFVLANEPELAATWAPAKGLLGWLSETGHKQIGMRYIVTAICFFALGGIEAAIMRLQLSRPNNALLSPDLYNQLFTIHGTTMMFLFAVPVMEGMAIYLVPLMVGTRNVAFPRLNAFGYFVYVIGGIFLYTMFALGAGADAGWFAYVPLSGPTFSPGKRVDTWSQMITFTELSALVVAIEISVTAFKQRAPGMSLNRIPLFVWSWIVVSFMIIFAMPAVMLDSGFLALDRLIATHFFNQSEGGDAIFYQHMFWFFGHPEVYIIFLPALGFVSMILSAFTRRKIFGYPVMVASLVFTGFMAFGLWVHHMFATGLPQLGESFFTAASIVISIPTGVQIFCWIATIALGRLTIRTPMLYVIGFFLVFVIGGLSGVMIASVPLDLQLHDTYFIVAHFHYVLIGGAVFPLFGAFFFWFPKWTGRMYREGLGQISFWLLLIGFNVTFFPMHLLGLLGMPRRVYTYGAQMGWSGMNALASVGAVLIALSIVIMLTNFLVSARSGEPAGANPWNADSLEWSVPSPPPPYNFLHIPVVSGANAVWDAEPDQPFVVGMRTHRRELLVTKTLDAEADHREEIPGSTILPFFLALTVTVALWGAIFFAWWFTIGTLLSVIVLLFWFWPKREDVEEHLENERRAERELLVAGCWLRVTGCWWPIVSTGNRQPATPREQPTTSNQQPHRSGAMRVLDVSALPMETTDSRSLLWWGNVGMLVIEGTMFAMTFAGYLYLKTANLDWPPQSVQLPPLFWPTAGLALMLVSGLVMLILVDRGAMRDDLTSIRIGHAICIAMAVAFLVIRAYGFVMLGFKWSDHAYGSMIWFILGMHTFHVLGATGEMISLLVYELVWPVTKKQLLDIRCTAVYWYFVILIWIPFYFLVYIAPYTMRKGG